MTRRDCPKGECVVAKIEELAAVLRDKVAHEARERLEALKFVVHLVADVHQPVSRDRPSHSGPNGTRSAIRRGRIPNAVNDHSSGGSSTRRRLEVWLGWR